MNRDEKTNAIIEYLFTCPEVANHPLFFNFAQAEDGNKQLVTIADDKDLNKTFIDGSELKRYTFTIIDYRSVVYQALVNDVRYPNENVDEFIDVQSIIDWITEQNDELNFPDFGTDCEIQEITALTEMPSLNGVDTSKSPALAKYSITIRVEYIDNSKKIWG